MPALVPPLPPGLPLSHLRERFRLRASESFPAGLVGDCPTAHETGAQFVAELGADDLWHLSACDMGCTAQSILDSAIDRKEPGDDDGEEAPAPKPSIFRSAYKRLSAEQLLADPPPLEFVLRPYIPRGCVSVLSGPGGSNKTTLLVYVAVCRALGRQMFRGVVPEEGETVILTTEDRIEDYHRKLAALRDHLGAEFDAQLVADRLHFIDLAGTPFRMVSAERGEQYLPTGAADELALLLRELAPRADWITLETVSRMTGGVENNSSLSILVEATQRLCKLVSPRCAATLVGHVSQDAARQGTTDAYAGRGGSALGDNGRSSMVLTGIHENNVEKLLPGYEIDPEHMKRLLVWAHPKGNGTPPTAPLILQRSSTRWGPVLELADLERPTVAAKPKSKAGRPAARSFDELKKAIIELVMTETLPIRAYGVCARLGGTKGTCLEAIRELVTAGVLSDQGKGLSVVRNDFRTNSEPTLPEPGSELGSELPLYNNKGDSSRTSSFEPVRIPGEFRTSEPDPALTEQDEI